MIAPSYLTCSFLNHADGQQYAVGGADGLGHVPASKRKEVEAELEEIFHLACSALGKTVFSRR